MFFLAWLAQGVCHIHFQGTEGWTDTCSWAARGLSHGMLK